MFTTTTTVEVKNHTIQMNDFEIEKFLSEPQPLLDKLSELLTSRPAARANGRKKMTRSARPSGETIECPKCGKAVKTRGLLIHQNGAKCQASAE